MTVRILHLASSLGPSALGRMLARVVPALHQDRFPSLIVNLGETFFPVQNVTTICHRLRYRFDLSRLAAIQRAASQFQPDLIHAWGIRAVRTGMFLRPKRIVVSHADRCTDVVTKWLIHKADHVLAMNEAEKVRYWTIGIKPQDIRSLPFGLDPIPAVDRVAIRKSLGLTESAKLIVASGGFDSNARLKHAVWAFDIVRYLHPNLHLVILGDGPRREEVGRFSQTLGRGDHRVHFAGNRIDAEAVIAASDAGWITHQVGGTTVALESLSHGVPVFAYQTPDTLTLPTAATTLIPNGDPATLAAATNRWLDSPVPISPVQKPLTTLATALADVYDK